MCPRKKPFYCLCHKKRMNMKILVVEVKKLMSQSFSFSLHHLRTLALASPPHTRVLHPPHLSSFLRIGRMSSSSTNTISEGSSSNISSSSDLDSIFKHKRIIRSNVRKSLKGMDPSQRALEDDAIQRLVLDAPWFKSSERLCAYISCHALREVDTSKVLAEILQTSPSHQVADEHTLKSKIVYVPRVEDNNSHMRMLHISTMDDLIANSMNILEPAPVDSRGNQRQDVMHASEPLDLLILPGLAFDKSGRRLGRGGGYYDTFLRTYLQLANKQNWKQPLLVALSYSVQILDDGVIPITPNDVYVDALVTPAGVISISSAALQRMEHSI